jgi:hypothetical protein
MSEGYGSFARRRRSAIALTLGVVAAIVMLWGFAPPRAGAASTCADGKACWWSETDYNGFRGERDCETTTFFFDSFKYSAKNRCSLQRVMVLFWYHDNGDVENQGCLDRNEERDNPGRFNAVALGAANGNRCF